MSSLYKATNTTGYEHPLDPNLRGVHHAMLYDADGSPAALPQLSQGTVIDSGFVVAGSGTGIALDKDTTYQMGRTDLGTVSDTLTILAAANGSNKSAIAAMTWIEQR